LLKKSSKMKIGFILFLLLFASCTKTASNVSGPGNPAVPGGPGFGSTDGSSVFSVPTVFKPGYLSPITDPTFGTKITKISNDAGTVTSSPSVSWGSRARHVYSKQQPWNATQSYFFMENSGGSPSPLLLDGKTLKPIKGLCGSLWDYRWHPSASHAKEMINVNSSGTVLEWYDVVNCTQTRSWTLPIAVSDLGTGEGNPSYDGRFVALGNGTQMFIVDMDPQPPYAAYPNKRIGPVVDFSSCGLASGCNSIDWVSISASGKYAVVSYDPDYQRVYDIDPDSLALTPHAIPGTSPKCAGDPAKGFVYSFGHADLSIDPFDSGEDVMMGQDWHSECEGKVSNRVAMVRLKDGAVTSLTLGTGESYPHHISTRNYDRLGWAYVTYNNAPGSRFDQEVIAVKMDGSHSVERLAHTHTDEGGNYYAEGHAVASPDGSKVVFSSDWTQNCGSGCGSSTNFQDYVIEAP